MCFLFSSRTFSHAHSVQHLKRPMEASDVRILQKYAPRIRYIEIMYYEAGLQASFGAYHALFLSCHRPILPNLVGLTWKVIDPTIMLGPGNSPDIFPYIKLFLLEGLQRLCIQIIPHHPQHLTLLSNIPSTLTQLIVTFSSVDDGERPGLGVVLPKWRNLSHLYIHDWDTTPDDLVIIATMANLRSLVFRTAHYSWTTDSGREGEALLREATMGSEILFPMLESLAMDVDGSISIATKVFDIFRFSRLFTIDLVFSRTDDTIARYTEFFRTLARHCDRTLLREFQLQYSLPTEPVFPFPVLTPLLEFPNLEVVILEGCFGSAQISISEEQLVQLILALPRIRYLDISPRRRWDDHTLPRLTLSSLLSIASRCPDIERIGLSIDAACAHTLRTLSDSPHSFKRVKNYSLQSLDFGYWDISNHEFVTSFLRVVFPNLKGVSWRGEWLPTTVGHDSLGGT